MDVCEIPPLAVFCQAADHATATVVVATLQFITDQVAGAAATLMHGMWALFETTTFVDVTSGAFTGVYNIVFGVAVFVMLGFFLIQVITGMLHRDPAALSRAALGLAKAVLGSFVALTLLATALEITDRLCLGIIAAAGTNLADVGDRITLLTAGTTATLAGGPGGAMMIALLLAGLVGTAAMILWFSLLIRKALLLVAIVFAPIALAGASWDATRGWLGRWASFVVALIVSKVVIVVFLLLATAQLTAPISTDLASLSDPITGVVLLLVAGFAPYLTYKAINFMGFDMYHAMSAEQEAKQALNRPVPIPTKWMNRSETTRILDGGTTGPTPPRPRGGVPAPAGPVSVGPAASGPASGTAAAGTGGASAGAGAAAAGPIAVGAVVAKETVAAGPKAGRFVARQTTGLTDAVRQEDRT
ncbi:conjugal transfer protein TrbL [Xylanimonas protaetiae]|uniref:Conjugal transfer protein TrbL n=1 Tax=Xylanimonas protaetiae TaxID=2509457 RepID=A0A4P6FDW0_9MICO|nr:conjugal transfer protein TrbL [Xylanimonas protaetiae]QAY68778.1 conjugal transfer protein TrbL [Xylanimonas protaetiae]